MGALLTAWKFLTSKAGMILGAAVALLLLVSRLISVGEDRERARQAERQKKAREGARRVQNEVRQKPADEQRQELRDKWSRD